MLQTSQLNMVAENEAFLCVDPVEQWQSFGFASQGSQGRIPDTPKCFFAIYNDFFYIFWVSGVQIPAGIATFQHLSAHIPHT